MATLLAMLCPAAAGHIVKVSDVPSYGQNPAGFSDYPVGFPGCGPTAGGMVIGYWEGQGYGNLIPGSNSWTDNRPAVEAMIGSQGHYDDYWGTDADPPQHADDCVADFMGTSRDSIPNGATAETNLHSGLVEYAKDLGYASANGWYSLQGGLWNHFVAEIDAGRPMVFAVDTGGDGTANHCVTVIGYDDTAGAERYYYYDPNHVDVEYDAAFQPKGNVMGVSTGHWFDPGDVPVPEHAWSGAQGTAWADGGNWSEGAPPDASSTAVFDAAAPRQPALGQDADVTGTLTVYAGGADSAGDGANTVTAPVALGAASTWTVGTDGTLALASGLDAGGFALAKDGPGILELAGATDLGGLDVQDGTVRITDGGTLILRAGGLTLATAAALDLTDNLLVDYEPGASPYDPSEAWVTTADEYAFGVADTADSDYTPPADLEGEPFDGDHLPEPATLALLAGGLAWGLARRRPRGG